MMDRITKEEMAVAYTVSRGRTENLPVDVNRTLGNARNARTVATGSEKVFNRMMIRADENAKAAYAQLNREAAVAPEKNIFTLTGNEKPKGKRK